MNPGSVCPKLPKRASRAIDDWEAIVAESLRGLPVTEALPVTEEVVEDTRELVYTSLRMARSPSSAGVVIAGFGKAPLFPALSHYFVDGVVANRVRMRSIESVLVDDDMDGFIRPFAQQGVVQTFMNGLDPRYHREIREFISETFRLLTDDIDGLYGTCCLLKIIAD